VSERVGPTRSHGNAADRGGQGKPVGGSARTEIPASTLTRKVADLEELLGTRLRIRTTRKLTLTDAGTAYVAAARRILELVREQERDATGEFATAKGELVVTAPGQLDRLHILPVINQFLAQYPDSFPLSARRATQPDAIWFRHET
jgi:DNA-binding transcriptional LysR family regulator